jgi:hypothetical protein
MPLNASHNRVQATVTTFFRYSLTDLFSKMVHGSPRFVRCFKPNNDRIPDFFDTQTVLEQLKYSGILAGDFFYLDLQVRRVRSNSKLLTRSSSSSGPRISGPGPSRLNFSKGPDPDFLSKSL